MTIEELKYEDIDEVYALTLKVFEYPVDVNEIKNLYLKINKDKDQYRFLVAKIDGKVAGYISISMSYNLFDGNEKFMTLWWVCAHPDYRRQGIATQLLKEAEKIAKENKCNCVCLLSENEREGAHEFYKKCGYNMGFKGFMKEL